MQSGIVGLLGSGQLSLMLAECCPRLGLEAVALGSPGDPASRAADIVPGTLDDEAALLRLFARARTIGFENEFVDCDKLEHVGQGVAFVPALSVIRSLQDKISQKRILERLGIPTADWFPRASGEDAGAFVARAAQRFPDGHVLKWARMGYDGKGVLISGDLRANGERAGMEQAAAFVHEAERAGIPVFAEEKVVFRRELAMVSIFSTRGELAHYPLVISKQSGGICRTVTGPATALGVDSGLEEEARKSSARLARGISLHGAFAIEFFESSSGRLLVNEIAPRVHNTGHYTQDCARTSQFENHLRAVFGQKLGPVDCDPAFAMVNLIGPPGIALPATGTALPEEGGVGVLHWYGKRDIRPGRKMGHLNGKAEDPAGLDLVLNALEQRRLKWESLLK